MMGSKAKARSIGVAAALLACAGLAMTAAPAAAQLTGDLRYLRGYDLYPTNPAPGYPMTLVLYGVFPTGCGIVESKTDAPVEIHLKTFASCPDSAVGTWTVAFALGAFAAGHHSIAITMSMDRPDSGFAVYHGTLMFAVLDSTPPPPDSLPPPPPPPSLVTDTYTQPDPATPSVPLSLTVFGTAPFDCPAVTHAAVLDSNKLALTLTQASSCRGDTTRAWHHTFDLGFQRAGHHDMDLAITLESDSVVHVPIHFLVYEDSVLGPPPPDSLEHLLSHARPNPFITESRFSVSLDAPADAHVAVFDILGRRVSTVFNGRLPQGTTELRWNGKHDDGSRAKAGVYSYRLEMRGRVVSRRLVLLRPQ